MSNPNWLDEIQWPARIVLFRFREDEEKPQVIKDSQTYVDEECVRQTEPVICANSLQYRQRIAFYRTMEMTGFASQPYYHDLVSLNDLDTAVETIVAFLSTPQGNQWTGESKRVPWTSLQK